MEYRVISTDDHIIEAPDTFDRLPAEFRDRQPRFCGARMVETAGASTARLRGPRSG